MSPNENLPEPVGYRILVSLPPAIEKSKGGIILPDSLKDKEQTASITGQVLKLGPDAYADIDKYPNGPWCQIGDWVVFRSYSGTRIKVGENEYRLINDDTVEAVTSDPRTVERAF
jgi:chaperonin GroES